MTVGSRIIAIGSPEDGNAGQSEQAPGTENIGSSDTSEARERPPEVPDEVADLAVSRWPGRALAAVSLTAIAGWTGLFAWANQDVVSADSSLGQWTSLVTGWSLPVLLVCVAWLLVMRNSSREATRFGDAARLLSQESAQLEARLVAVNRELSLAREFLASQTRDLESLGRVASERLTENAGRIEELVRENGARVETIGEVSQVALENMEKLRGQLPVISSSAKDVTNNIGNAGRTAHSQIEEMVKGFNRINEFGQASEKQIFALRAIVDETLSGFSEQCDQLEKIAGARFAELESRGTEFRTKLDKQEIDALAAIRHRATALAEEMDEVRATLDAAEQAGLDALRTRLAALRGEGSDIAKSLSDSEHNALAGWREHISAIEEERSALFARIEQADSQSAEQARGRLASLTVEAELIEKGIAERAERLIAELAARRATAEEDEREAVAQFSAMLAELDSQVSQRAEAHRNHVETLSDQVGAIVERLGHSEAEIVRIAEAAEASGQQISDKFFEISSKLAEGQAKLVETDARFSGLTESSVRLLELLRASTEQTETELPRSLADSEAALSAAEARARDVADSLREAGKNGEWLANQIEGAGTSLKAILADITTMQVQLRDQAISHQESLDSLRSSLREIVKEGDDMSEKARSELEDAIASLETSAKETVAIISEQGASGVAEIADRIRQTSAELIGKAIHNGAADVSGQLEQAASYAAGVSREATIQLRDQLSAVNELVGNLENRVAHARERAEEQVNNDFARRAALITEALNSNAIDIAKALSTEVSDTAWQGYLRGDRGIFTRRAVSLIDNSDAKTIQQVFERDHDFREHVSRYIHDFEAILRQVLSTRDGTALGVTLLSSDMGKLYVALAQAIERLRN